MKVTQISEQNCCSLWYPVFLNKRLTAAQVEQFVQKIGFSSLQILYSEIMHEISYFWSIKGYADSQYKPTHLTSSGEKRKKEEILHTPIVV